MHILELQGQNTSNQEAPERFRFLHVKYGEDIQALNRAWVAYFADFESILRMTPTYNNQYDLWYSAVPQLDWLRFRPYNWAKHLVEWSAIVREIDPQTVLLADVLGNDTLHNRSGDYFGATDWLVAQQVEVLGPRWTEEDSFRWAQFWRASLSAGQGKQVIISELMTPNRSMVPTERSSMVDQIRLWSYQAIFNGIQGVIYWQYRPFRRGIQVSGRGLCNPAGEPNEYAAQAAEVAAFVERNADLLAGAHPDHAGCAVLHDANAQDIYSAIHNGDFYTDAHAGIFQAFWQHGISPAYVTSDTHRGGVPDWVRILAVPCNVSLAATTAHALTEFLKRGGVLITESRFALLDEDATLWPEAPGGLAGLVGFAEKSLPVCSTIPFLPIRVAQR